MRCFININIDRTADKSLN